LPAGNIRKLAQLADVAGSEQQLRSEPQGGHQGSGRPTGRRDL
jgi:hypothetical protein